MVLDTILNILTLYKRGWVEMGSSDHELTGKGTANMGHAEI